MEEGVSAHTDVPAGAVVTLKRSSGLANVRGGRTATDAGRSTLPHLRVDGEVIKPGVRVQTEAGALESGGDLNFRSSSEGARGVIVNLNVVAEDYEDEQSNIDATREGNLQSTIAAAMK